MTRGGELAAGGPTTFGLRLLLFSLGVLFLAGLLGYVITRQRLGADLAVEIPRLMYLSIAALLATSLCVELAWRRLRRAASGPARRWLRLGALAVVAFLAVQTPALLQLLAGHRAAVSAGNPLLGFVFFLVLLHALHVLGGLAALVVVAGRSWRRPLNPDRDGATVRLSARYWHFLDVVWLVMFGVFLLS
ncbi:MAG TPA: cytochrome c oxidase subunit 3 [Candidatus Krumholzibacteria bacterium]|nr:cytochrome c oxidase subunit 3 [Candidatus Krumholzibacteria bacterium]HPD72636.1 cytochrome c oxidase subunit 3 [Candidatus Krumholzibacteria bacterium]HRY40432.1 cytochrome c oxidase subunit 3 [Candidatus Krumholzibacteria bacterium]